MCWTVFVSKSETRSTKDQEHPGDWKRTRPPLPCPVPNAGKVTRRFILPSWADGYASGSRDHGNVRTVGNGPAATTETAPAKPVPKSEPVAQAAQPRGRLRHRRRASVRTAGGSRPRSTDTCAHQRRRRRRHPSPHPFLRRPRRRRHRRSPQPRGGDARPAAMAPAGPADPPFCARSRCGSDTT